MAGGFDPVDPQRCRHYAGFASHLDRKAFDFIYWFLFAFVIFMLFLSSWKYSGDLDKCQMLGLEPESRGYKSKMKKCMMACSIYAAISIVAVVMEVYALMALQFCDGEDLMPLYWSTWAMMQVGSVIAIFGILLAISNTIRGRRNPPWALALGTPVLVVAGIGHAVHRSMRERVRRVRSRSCSSRNRLESSDLPLSREQTLRADDSDKEEVEITAKFLGFTPDGAPVIKFLREPVKIKPENGLVIGRREDGNIITFPETLLVAGNSDRSNSPSPGRWVEQQESPPPPPSPSPRPPSPAISPSSKTPTVRIAEPQAVWCKESPV